MHLLAINNIYCVPCAEYEYKFLQIIRKIQNSIEKHEERIQDQARDDEVQEDWKRVRAAGIFQF